MNHRFLDHASVAQMLADDALEERRRDVTVPDPLRVHDNDRSARADAEAGGFAALHAGGTEQQPFALQQGRQQAIQVAAPMIRRAESTDAYQDMSRVWLHAM